jgi:hypothetical protein
MGLWCDALGICIIAYFQQWLRALYSANGSKDNVTTEFLNGVSERGMTVAEASLSANSPQVSYDSDYERGQGSIMLYNWVLIFHHCVELGASWTFISLYCASIPCYFEE